METTPTRIALDALSPLSHKELIGDPWHPPTRSVGPSWVPPSERRRLNGYIARAAYVDCVARLLLPVDVPDHIRRRHREYGDVASFVDRVVASVLGDDWQIAVDGADVDLAEGPDLGDPPAEAGADASPLEKRVARLRRKAWDDQASAVVDAWEAALGGQPLARARQTLLRQWANDAQLAARIHEGEHDVAALADGVYVLWPRVGDWPTLEVFDPGMYFPELDGVVRGEFPKGLHLAWDFEKTDAMGVTSRWVRRMTLRLVPISDLRSSTDRRGVTSWLGPDGEPLPAGAGPVLYAGETVDGDGTIRRRMPWHGPDDPGASVTCVFSDGEWPLDAVTVGDVWALSDDRATWNTRAEDWGVDFLPLLHVPNTPTGKEHFGRGIFDRQAQLLDDIAQIDGRTMNGSQYLGSPTLGLEGASLPAESADQRGSVWRGDGSAAGPSPSVTVGPGKIFTGKITAIDMSAGIEKLMGFDSMLRDRFLENVGAPAELFGRVTGATSQSTSAAHLALKYAPWAQVVSALRLPRAPKYELLLKMAQRLAQVATRPDGSAVLEAGPTPRARLLFGNFLPMNQADVVTMVAAALGAHAISRQTAVSLLVAAGIPIDDARGELDRIVSEDTDGAFKVAEALAGAPGAETVVADRLGVADQIGQAPVAPAGPVPTPTLPPAPGAGG